MVANWYTARINKNATTPSRCRCELINARLNQSSVTAPSGYCYGSLHRFTRLKIVCWIKCQSITVYCNGTTIAGA